MGCQKVNIICIVDSKHETTAHCNFFYRCLWFLFFNIISAIHNQALIYASSSSLQCHLAAICKYIFQETILNILVLIGI